MNDIFHKFAIIVYYSRALLTKNLPPTTSTANIEKSAICLRFCLYWICVGIKLVIGRPDALQHGAKCINIGAQSMQEGSLAVVDFELSMGLPR